MDNNKVGIDDSIKWTIITSGMTSKEEIMSAKEIFGDEISVNGYRTKGLDQIEAVKFIIRHFDLTNFIICYALAKVVDKVISWFKNNKKTGSVWIAFSIKQGDKSVSFNIMSSDENIDKIMKFISDDLIKSTFNESKDKAIITIGQDNDSSEIKIRKMQ